MSPAGNPSDFEELEQRVAQLERNLLRLAALHRVAQSVAKASTVEAVLCELAREVGAALPRVGEISIAEWDRRRALIRDVLEFKPHLGRRVAIARKEFPLAGLPDLESLLRRGRGWLVSLLDDPATPPEQQEYMRRFGWYSLLQLPLVCAGRTIGVIEVVDIREAAPFDDETIEFCETIASQAALTLKQAQLFERIRRMADHDPLTGLANPRTFRRRVAAAQRSSRASGVPLGVIMIDLDDFKALNDAKGHAHGDNTLRRVASLVRQHARGRDTAARLGGDELALLVTAAGAAELRAVAERLLAALARAGINSSAGIAVFADGPLRADQLIEQADAALLRAKRLGKGRLEVAHRAA